MTSTLDRRQDLEKILRSYGSVLVACSGGVDSVLLAAIAARVLKDCAIAVTAVSPSLASGEIDDARAAVTAAGIRHIEIPTTEMDNPLYAENSLNRCYHCKDVAYDTFRSLADREGVSVIIDGTNADDISDFRPGRRAAKKHGVRSPFAEAGIGKQEIREWAKDLGLKVWDKPSAACLASRVPYGSPVTIKKLQRIDQAEKLLKTLGFRQCRVRDHGSIARIEILASEFHAILEHRETVLCSFSDLGFNYITLDLEGFRSGSMNEVIKPE